MACFRECPDLEALHFVKSNLNFDTCKNIGKILSDYKNIRELDLTGSYIMQQCSKEIADGLMRAKRIESIRLRSVTSIGTGISQILYNLAFSPRIRNIDISQVQVGTNAECCEGVYKLIKISGSLEYLNISQTGIYDGLSRDFFTALGENKTLKAFLIDSGSRFYNQLNEFGKSIAFNSMKNGSLEVVSAVGGFDQATANTFFRGMFISEYEHEVWYGDKNLAAKMKGEQLEGKFVNPLKILFFGKQQFNWNDSIADIKKRANPSWPSLVHLFSSGLQILDLTQSSINCKRSLEVLAACIENPLAKTSIRVLNLSKNHINKEGGKILAEVLGKNNTIEALDLSGNLLGVSGTKALSIALKTNTKLRYLSLYSNIVDVDGARALKETLVVNDTLQFLDVGSNRLRDKGIMEIAEGILGNKTCALKGIGLRFNFISEDGADKFFAQVLGKSKIENIYIRNNDLSEPFLIKLDE